jgi:hypothetical protein
MNDKHSVMFYSALLCAFSLLAAGFCTDNGMKYTGLAFLAISAISLVALMLVYLGPYFFIRPDHDVVRGSTRLR